MSPLKQHMYQRLRSAQKWLTKAEQAFDKQHDIRAELDLMLAQAELQHVKEANRPWQWRYKYVVVRHGLALTLAALMVVVVGGVYLWNHNTKPVIPVPLARQITVTAENNNKAKISVAATVTPKENSQPVQPAMQQIPVLAPSKVEQSEQPEQPKQPEQSEQARQTSRVEQPRQVEQPVALSTDEMQKLVRAAGKSLRGQ